MKSIFKNISNMYIQNKELNITDNKIISNRVCILLSNEIITILRIFISYIRFYFLIYISNKSIHAVNQDPHLNFCHS